MKRLCYTLLAGVLFVSCNLSRTNFIMNNEAMLPTIRTGSLVKITKQVDSLDYGDIVAFNYSGIIDGFFEPGPFLYRIVGLPGDSIAVEKEVCIINGKKNKHRLIGKNVPDEDLEDFFRNITAEYEEVLPNGKNIRIYRFELTGEDLKKIDPYYVNVNNYEHKYNGMDAIKIPGNHYFVMGDFRSNANDSRKIGAISREQIFGKVVEIKPPKKK